MNEMINLNVLLQKIVVLFSNLVGSTGFFFVLVFEEILQERCIALVFKPRSFTRFLSLVLSQTTKNVLSGIILPAIIETVVVSNGLLFSFLFNFDLH